ncbi:MAG: type II toxin-antitoxin system VapC family toxin [Bdellovibrionota bacterium]
MNFFLDTNICIYLLKDTFPEVKNSLLKHKPNKIKIPSIVKAELLFGAVKSKQKETFKVVEQFLMPFEIISFCTISAEHYGAIRQDLEKKGKMIGANDLIIASTVLANNGTLVSHNSKEFKRVKGLEFVDWLTR